MKNRRLLKASRLVELGACPKQVRRFRRLWGTQVYVTVPRMVAVSDKFDWTWGAHHLLTSPARAEYNKVCAPAWVECDKVYALARAEYNKVYAAARAEYNKVCAAAWARAYIQDKI